MTEKRFRYYEHKGADYILDNPNTEVDFIEMLGDCLEAEEIVDLLNKLSDENEQLKQEKEYWKGDSCNCSNYLSILEMDCQIVQEAICDLKKVIDVDTEASKLLDELDDKFDELNQHRIKMYSRGF